MLLIATAPGRADETFLCSDGSSITIDSSNRSVMQDHPCVRAWFVNDLAHRKALNAEVDDSRGAAKGGPLVHRHTVRRAMALRDLHQRPAYLAWVRTRAAEVQPAPRREATQRGHVRSLLDKPAARTTTKSAIRIRFRRR